MLNVVERSVAGSLDASEVVSVVVRNQKPPHLSRLAVDSVVDLEEEDVGLVIVEDLVTAVGFEVEEAGSEVVEGVSATGMEAEVVSEAVSGAIEVAVGSEVDLEAEVGMMVDSAAGMTATPLGRIFSPCYLNR